MNREPILVRSYSLFQPNSFLPCLAVIPSLSCRHETKDTVRLTNTFKMETHHSMVVPTHVHHPLHLSRELLVHLFEEATQWFYDVSQQESHFM